MDFAALPKVKGWRTLPLDKLMQVMAFLPPPPMTGDDGRIYSFMDPQAAQRLHQIREAFMAMLAEAKPDPEPLTHALAFLSEGMPEGDHHKAWMIDQLARILAGDRYEDFVRAAKHGADGPDTYTWDVGIPP